MPRRWVRCLGRNYACAALVRNMRFKNLPPSEGSTAHGTDGHTVNGVLGAIKLD